MGKTSETPTPSSKRSRPEDSPGSISPPGNSSIDILVSIEQRLSSFDARLNLKEILHKEFQEMPESLEFGQQQVVSLAAENKELREWVKSLTGGMSQLSRDNTYLKGIPKQAEEDPEKTVTTS